MNNWQTIKLGEILEYEQPTKYLVGSKNYKDEYETPVLTAGKTFILGNTKERNGIFPTMKLPVIIFDDFTTATKFVDFPFKVKSSAMKILHPIKDKSDAKFLFYIMQNINFDHIGIHKRYWISEFSRVEILLPPLLEQHRIVKILDEVFGNIEKANKNAKKNLQNSKELFESYLQNIFTNPGKNWEEKTLKEITSILGDGLHGTPKYTIHGDYYFINGNNLDSGKIVFKENTKRVSIEEYEKYKKNLNDKTVLVSINGTLGNVAFYNNEKVILGKSACYFNLIDGVSKDFIKYFLESPYFFKYAHKEATGATIKNVSLKTMRELKINLPSTKIQESIVAKLANLSAETKKLEAIYKHKLADLEELKKSVLKKAFSGEL
jgi:type I restriction enzyme S subunit